MTPYWLSVTTVVFLLNARNTPNQVEAADFGHIDVDECNVVMRPVASGENLLAIAGGIHAVPGGF